jgi:hypothetical protein
MGAESLAEGIRTCASRTAWSAYRVTGMPLPQCAGLGAIGRRTDRNVQRRVETAAWTLRTGIVTG